MDNKIEERYIFLDFDGVLNTMEYLGTSLPFV